MEIALITPQSIRIKGKSATLYVNDTDSKDLTAVLMLGNIPEKATPDETVILSGPGEYEISGIKISGSRARNHVIYTFMIDKMTVAIGTIKDLEAVQKTVQESQIIIIDADESTDAAFISNFSPSVVLFYNTHGKDCAATIVKENINSLAKYQVTADKLPQEMETYILASGK